MSSATRAATSRWSRTGLPLAAMMLGVPLWASAQQPHALRVCADPNNLPFSNQQGQGFENHLAQMIGQDLHEPVTYVWYRQGEKFFKQTLNAGICDVVMGVPTGFDEAATTHPYYRSTYVFITRRDRHLHLTGFDDPQLRKLKIGVHVLADQDDSEPPVHAFTSRGIVKNLVGFSIFGRSLSEANPAADLIRAVASGQVDVAVAWGPLAGYFARQSSIPLDITPISGDPMQPNLPFHFDIGLGTREGDHALQQQLNAELTRLTQRSSSFFIPTEFRRSPWTHPSPQPMRRRKETEPMRLPTLLFTGSLLLFAAGCHSRQKTSVAAGNRAASPLPPSEPTLLSSTRWVPSLAPRRMSTIAPILTATILSHCRTAAGSSIGTTALAATADTPAAAWDQASAIPSGSMATATIRSSTPSHRVDPKACPPGAARFPSNRYGSLSPTSSPWEHRLNPIRRSNLRMKRSRIPCTIRSSV